MDFCTAENPFFCFSTVSVRNRAEEAPAGETEGAPAGGGHGSPCVMQFLQVFFFIIKEGGRKNGKEIFAETGRNLSIIAVFPLIS